MKRLLALVLALSLLCGACLAESREEMYTRALELMRAGDYLNAAEYFDALEGYLDSEEKAGEARKLYQAGEDGGNQSSEVFIPTPAIHEGTIDAGWSEDSALWRTQYLAFIQSQGYLKEGLERLNLEEQVSASILAENAAFSVYDLDGNGVPELLVSLHESLDADPVYVLVYTCQATSPVFLNGMKPGCYMYSYAINPDYPGLAGMYHRNSSSDDLYYITIQDNKLTVEYLSHIEYFDVSRIEYRETRQSDDDELYDILNWERLSAGDSAVRTLHDSPCEGLDEAGWYDYLHQWREDSAQFAAQRSSRTPKPQPTYAPEAQGTEPAWDDGDDETDGATGYEGKTTVQADSGDTHIRSGPGRGYESLGVLKLNQKLPFTGKVQFDERPVAWYAVDWNGREAWVSSRYTNLY